ncbi:hypothetical protein [Brachybacterium kimchii]|uniref:Tail terminator n=1 Tax=Brachybacterium kimchii TaxID=2942909 RepID=A0ABY4NA33_9MICO|nr:hypothetical protein [Brachybacterium kimchii]UQN30656.1 hypothetical protein M4486_04965 [Brachybacterium kimchii]
MTRFSLDASALMRTLVLETVAGRTQPVTVETEPPTDLRDHLPLVIVDCSPATGIANGRPETGATFTLTLHTAATERAAAKELCDDVYGGLYRLWRAGTTTDHGWLSHLSDRQQPARATTPPTGTTGLYAYTAALAVTARH